MTNTLNIRIAGAFGRNVNAYVDGELVPTTYSDGAAKGVYKTEKDKVTIELFECHEFASTRWWLYMLLFYVVGFFGIFDLPQGKRTLTVNFKATIALKPESEIKFSLLSRAGEKAAEVEYNGDIETEQNECAQDTTVKRRKRLYLAIRIVSWIAIIAVAISLIISKL